MSNENKLEVVLRAFRKSDAHQLFFLQHAAYPPTMQWTYLQMLGLLRNSETIGMVAEEQEDHRIVAAAIALGQQEQRIMRVAVLMVKPRFQRLNLGKMLFSRLISITKKYEYQRILIEAPITTVSQTFLTKMHCQLKSENAPLQLWEFDLSHTAKTPSPAATPATPPARDTAAAAQDHLDIQELIHEPRRRVKRRQSRRSRLRLTRLSHSRRKGYTKKYTKAE